MSKPASEIRKYITTSRSGHIHLTLVHKATRIKVYGQYKHASVAQAMASEYPEMVKELTARVAALASQSEKGGVS